MAHPLAPNMNGMNPSQTKEYPAAACDKMPQAQPPSNVRHIPIFVEGRDEPLLNKNVERSSSSETSTTTTGVRQQPQTPDPPKSTSIFSRVKDIPVRKIIPDFQTMPKSATRTASPLRQVPVNVTTHTTSRQPHPAAPIPSQQQNVKSQPSSAAQQSLDAITKIQKIQHDVLALMNRVEQYRGGSRRDKDYLYLDEMLTQNLLKLDTIDAEGKENIKAARKEAINCINKCIAVLEAKTDSTTNSALDNSSLADSSSQQAEIS